MAALSWQLSPSPAEAPQTNDVTSRPLTRDTSAGTQLPQGDWTMLPTAPASRAGSPGPVEGPSTLQQRPFSQSQTASISMLSAPTGISRSSGGRRKTVRDLGVGKVTVDEYGSPVIRNVFDLYKEVRTACGMIANVWGWTTTNNSQAATRMSLPALVKVFNGGQVHVIPGFLIQDIRAMNVAEFRARSLKEWHPHTKPGISRSPLVEVLHLDHASPYFSQMVILMKLRWLLRLHSAACELDYKLCSFREIIIGLNYLVLQSHSELTADSGFEKYKIDQHVGSHVQLESVVDDITDQLQRALGRSWRGFLEYVSTCDPNFTQMNSQMEMLHDSKIVSNSGLAQSLDCAFIAQFLRLERRVDSPTRLSELYMDMELLGMTLPEVPPLSGAYHLVSFVSALMRPLRKDREKIRGKQAEKLAQLDAVLLCHAVELKLPDVVAKDADFVMEEGRPPSPVTLEASLGVVAPTYPEGEEGDHEDGPQAAKVAMDEKPFIKPGIFHACVWCIQHHVTFPVGLRERLHHVLTEDFNLTQAQVERLTIGTTSNVQGSRLSEKELFQIFDREKNRLRQYSATYGKNVSHLLVPSVVTPPLEKGLPAKFHTEPAKQSSLEKPLSGFSGADMTRSLPEFRSTSTWLEGREPFKVPKGTGPLTYDSKSRKLKMTGLFIKMPPLDG
mmetsp:Transcript_8543/g.15277  ORF Transcript_8543/g.15277 Transcript_8543/m.15277 type:complete len:671 (-) Transcript_8543:61-2073(-)